MNIPRLRLLSGIAFLFAALWEVPAEAYVDPGTASYTFQIVIGALLGALYLVRTYWNRLVITLRSLVRRDVAPHQ